MAVVPEVTVGREDVCTESLGDSANQEVCGRPLNARPAALIEHLGSTHVVNGHRWLVGELRECGTETVEGGLQANSTQEFLTHGPY